jgi:DNA-binding NarL/FixJ family response regulator
MPPTVLIVDDHPSFRATARALLESEGFVVVGEAMDGGGALALAGELHPEVVLLDVQLPDLTGFEVAERLASMNGASAAVVLVSSRDRCDYGSQIDECGARGFICKGDLTGAAVRALLG